MPFDTYSYDENGLLKFGDTSSGQSLTTAPTPYAIDQARQIDYRNTGEVKPFEAYLPPKPSIFDSGATAMNGAGGASAGTSGDVVNPNGAAGANGAGRVGTGNAYDAQGAQGAPGAGAVAPVRVQAPNTSSGVEGIVKPSPATNRGAVGVNTPERAKEKADQKAREDYQNMTSGERSATYYDKATEEALRQQSLPVVRAERLKGRKIETEGKLRPEDSEAIASEFRDTSVANINQTQAADNSLAEKMIAQEQLRSSYEDRNSKNAVKRREAEEAAKAGVKAISDEGYKDDRTTWERVADALATGFGQYAAIMSKTDNMAGKIVAENRAARRGDFYKLKDAKLGTANEQLAMLRQQNQAASQVEAQQLLDTLAKVERVYQIQALNADSPESQAKYEKLYAEARLAQAKLIAEHQGKIKTTVETENAIVGGGGGNRSKMFERAGDLQSKAAKERREGDGTTAPIVIGDTAYKVPKNLEQSSVHEARKFAQKTAQLDALLEEQKRANEETGWMGRQAAKFPIVTTVTGVGARQNAIATQVADAASQVLGMGGVASEKAAEIMRGVNRGDPESIEMFQRLRARAQENVAKSIGGEVDAASTSQLQRQKAAVGKAK